MPIRRPTLDTTFVRYHPTAASLLASCQNDFMLRERDANIILPFAIKTKYAEPQSPVNVRRNSIKPRSPILLNESDTESSDNDIMRTPVSPVTKDEQFWLSVWTSRARQPARLDMVLSCTTGPIGKYPVFLYSNVPDDDMTSEWIVPRIELLVKRLRCCLSTKRVFSVFGPVPLTRAFVSAWVDSTEAMPVEDPYYAAKHTYCTRATLSQETSAIPVGHELRLADMSDLHRGTELCYGFAAGSEPFVLSIEDATKEARGYIANRQMYVYNIVDERTGAVETASIVCVTRTSQNVSAITKVYTNPMHRGKKCAEKLVRFVSHTLLTEGKKSSVVLFVAHDNLAAEKVYDRVGFQGLCGKPRPEGVSDWVEIGFENTEIGHW
ncbi:hypothetical protein M407DRAFT_85086 [Tulasnella calospora MUT 4182]|uniref:N-acetyltransferase domain-containing protein n=1 Tax=Tulasnella calospora MUT 4182 TaxID=1051891 RepID=A0A0C3K7K6_9AGAM|nr:hypothetical protein M407DRAFT_85086 [Tulasnella calospora MUT 4182]